MATNVLEENMMMIDRVSNKGLGILGGADAAIGRPQKSIAQGQGKAGLLPWCRNALTASMIRLTGVIRSGKICTDPQK